MYKIYTDKLGFNKGYFIHKVSDNSYIPIIEDNLDYRQFLLDWNQGIEVLSTDGKVIPYGTPPS